MVSTYMNNSIDVDCVKIGSDEKLDSEMLDMNK